MDAFIIADVSCEKSQVQGTHHVIFAYVNESPPYSDESESEYGGDFLLLIFVDGRNRIDQPVAEHLMLLTDIGIIHSA